MAAWIKETGLLPSNKGCVVLTFVVDTRGRLLVADRHSEHVACAGGEHVHAAGELSLVVDSMVEVVGVTNQSTGYCPDSSSWAAVAAALTAIGIRHPNRFTHEFVFRRCVACGERNIIKEAHFVCDLCGWDLPKQWNF